MSTFHLSVTQKQTHIPQVGTLSASSGQLKKLSTFACKVFHLMCIIVVYKQTFIHFKNMLLTKFVEVPNTNIKEEVLSDFGYDLCYDMAQQYGHAQLVWYVSTEQELLRESIRTKIKPSTKGVVF